MSTDEPDAEDLAERFPHVAQLEQQLKEADVDIDDIGQQGGKTRRDLLAGSAGLLGLGGFLTAGSGTAAAGDEQVGSLGTDGNRLDAEIEDLDLTDQSSTPAGPGPGQVRFYAKNGTPYYKPAGGSETQLGSGGGTGGIFEDTNSDGVYEQTTGSGIETPSVNTEELSGGWGGQLLVFTAGAVSSINPTETTTPVQDAVDLAESNDHGGQIILPPGKITEAETVNITEGVEILGRGLTDAALPETRSSQSIIEWPAGVDHMTIDVQASLDGFTFQGAGPSTTNIRSLQIGDTGADVRNLNLGNLGFRQFAGFAIRSTTNTVVFQSHLGDHLNISDVDAGSEPAVIDLRFGFNTTIGHLSGYPTDAKTGSDSTLIRTNEFGLSIDSVNVGGTCNRLIERQSSVEPLVIGQWNFEPDVDSNPSNVFDLEQGPVTIGSGKVTNQDVETVFALSFNNRLMFLAKPRLDGATTATTILRVFEQPQGPSWYFGPASDISNPDGYSTGLIRSMDTAGTGNA